jgi:hypothetical protein
MEATMLVHTLTAARTRRAVKFRAIRSARDMLLSLPIVDGDVTRDPDAVARTTGAWKGW